MNFESIDRYLLDGASDRGHVVQELLRMPSELPAALPFYEGMRMLGARTPDLSIIALRLVLAGKRADDASVVSLRELITRVRAGGAQGEAARSAYQAALA